jgi:hypothetical protein
MKLCNKQHFVENETDIMERVIKMQYILWFLCVSYIMLQSSI